MTEWIKCSERLPENGTYVLYYDVNYDKVDKSFYDYDCFLSTSKALHNVTHWMPLPEPPEIPK